MLVEGVYTQGLHEIQLNNEGRETSILAGAALPVLLVNL
jgi:hypothetical protein